MIDDRLEGDSLRDDDVRKKARGRRAGKGLPGEEASSEEESSPRIDTEEAIAALFAAGTEGEEGAEEDTELAEVSDDEAEGIEDEPDVSDVSAVDDADLETEETPTSTGTEDEAAGGLDSEGAIEEMFGRAESLSGDDFEEGSPTAEDPLVRRASSLAARGDAEATPASAVDESGPETEAEEDSALQMSAAELCRAVEAVLFASAEPLPVRTLADLFQVTGPDIREAIESLREHYVDTDRAFRVEEIAGGIQVLTLPLHNVWIRRLRQKEREGRLSAAALESLAVIAYKQPITRADLENIRGVGCGPTLRTLMDRALIQVVGKDESLGRPLLYGTTRRFLESFGLSSLRELPQPEVLPRGAGGGPPAALRGGGPTADDGELYAPQPDLHSPEDEVPFSESELAGEDEPLVEDETGRDGEKTADEASDDAGAEDASGDSIPEGEAPEDDRLIEPPEDEEQD